MISQVLSSLPPDMNPFDSPRIRRPYDSGSVVERVYNKLWTEEFRGLTVSPDVPMIGISCPKLTPSDGALLSAVLPPLLSEGVTVLAVCDDLGMAGALAERFPRQFAVIPYSTENLEELCSGADLMLIPETEWELPLALSLRYGALPVLAEAQAAKISLCDVLNPDGRCFTFPFRSSEDVNKALLQGLNVYDDIELWEAMQKRCMDFAK